MIRAACDAFDAIPAAQFYGWCAVLAVLFVGAMHFVRWRNR